MATATMMTPCAYEPPLGRGAFSPVMPSLSQQASNLRLAAPTSVTNGETGHARSKSHRKSATRSARASSLPTTSCRSSPSKLHKTSGRPSVSTLSSVGDSRPSFTPPQAVPEEPFMTPLISTSTAPNNSTHKILPYLRKRSGPGNTNQERDQGRLDLSRSRSETDPLSGLGMRDFGTARGVMDGPLIPTHTRNISSGSQISVNSASASFRSTQPFVQPLRPTPRPFASAPATSVASSVIEDGSDDDDDENELNAIYEAGDYCNNNIFPRGHRSHSMSASGVAPSTSNPASTVSDLAFPQRQAPLTTSASQTDLSMHSRRSSRSLIGRARRDTDISRDTTHPASPVSRTSLDHSFSFSFASQPEPPTTTTAATATSDARIRAARQRFEEKEAHKDRKLARRQATLEARNAARQRQDHRKPSSRRESITSIATAPGGTLHVVSTAPPPPTHIRTLSQHSTRTRTGTSEPAKSQHRETGGILRAHAYEDLQPAPLPSSIMLTDENEAFPSSDTTFHHPSARSRRDSPQKGLARFSAWLHTRALSCAKALA